MVNPLTRWQEQLQLARDQEKTRVRPGKQGRAQIRLHDQHKVEQIAFAAVTHYLPTLLRESANGLEVDTNWFLEQWSLLVASLPVKYDSHSKVNRGLSAILQRLHAGNVQGCWSLPLVSIPLTLQRLSLPYHESWFDKAKRCAQAQQQWHEELAQRPARGVSDSVLLLDILYSAVFHSGVHQLDILHAFLVAVSKKTRLCATPEQVWLPLTLDVSNLPTNHYSKDHVALTQCKVFLSLPTLGLIYRWYRRQETEVAISEKRDEFCSWVKPHLLSPLKSLQQLCQGASLVTGLQPGVCWPQILSHVASGMLQSTALPHERWLSLHHPSVGDGVAVRAGLLSSAAIELPPIERRRYEHGRARPYSSLLDRLRKILAEKLTVNRKNTSKACIASLSELLNDVSLSQPEHILIDWLLHAARDRRNKPSTLQSYLSRGGQQWLNLCYGHDLALWDGERFLSGYRALLETCKGSAVFHIQSTGDGFDGSGDADSPSSKGDKGNSHHQSLNQSSTTRNASYMAARLSSLHAFACSTYQLAPLPEDLMSRVRLRPHVRACYISEVAFNELLRSLGQKSTEAYERLSVIYTVAFRAGLRLGEILKLRLKDIEHSSELWIYIRDTQLDDGKSGSATRKIPLGVLLTDQERLHLDAYLAPLWIQMKHHVNALVFPSDDGVLIPLSSDEVTAPLTDRLLTLTGQRYTFHHLRHTALSRLQLVLHHKELGLHQLPGRHHFMPWTEERCVRIYRTITQASTTQSDYWALAQLAGHQTPETTLNNYLHFSDWVSAACLRQAEYEWPPALRGIFTGMSQAKLAAEDWFTGALSWERCSQALLLAIKPWTREVAWKINPMPTQPPVVKCKLDFCATLMLLRLIARREDISAMYARYDITKPVVDELLHQARLLRSLRTQRQHTRLIRAKYPWQALAPGAMRSHVENAALNQVVDKAREVFKTQKAALIEWVEYVLRHSNTHNSGLPFTSPADLATFLQITLQLMPASRVGIRITCSGDVAAKEAWKLALGQRNIQMTMQHATGKNNRAVLRIVHPDEQGISQRATARRPDSKQFATYSTPLLRSVAFVLAVKLLTIDEIRQLAE
jgi:integrase